jgi:hypothetical protein
VTVSKKKCVMVCAVIRASAWGVVTTTTIN